MMKGQGLPVQTIVLAALAILVLVLLVGFTTGGLGKIFSAFRKTTGSSDIQSIQATCEQLCNSFKYSQTTEEAENSDYATKTFWVDKNGNGKKDPDEMLHCWEKPINVYCSVEIVLPDGSSKICAPDENKNKVVCS